MTEQFAFGGSTYPLQAASSNSLLLDADPALFLALDYFSYCITNYLGLRIVAEAGAIGAPITTPVAFVFPYDPIPFLKEVGVKFPLLAIWRTKEKYNWIVNAYTDRVGDWMCAYVLPPLTAGQTERCRPILSAIGPVLNARIENMGDPGYTLPTGFVGGTNTNVWAACGVEEIYLDTAEIGAYQASDAQQILFPAWIGTLKVKERDMPKPDAAFIGGPFAGLDAEIDNVTDDSPPLAVVNAAINFPDLTALGSGSAVGVYRGDSGVTAGTDATLVAAVADKSSAANSLTAPGTNPFSLTDEVSRQKAIRFDGSSTYLTSAAISGLASDGAKSLVCLFRLWDTLSRSSIVLVTNGASGIAFEANTSGTVGGKFGLSAGGSTFDTQFSTDNNWHSVVVKVSASTGGTSIASSVSVYVDGLAATLTLRSGTGLWSSIASCNLIALGGYSSALSTTCAHADIGVAAVYTSALSSSDTASAIAYCNDWLLRDDF